MIRGLERTWTDLFMALLLLLFFTSIAFGVSKQPLEDFSQNLNLRTHAAPSFLYSAIGTDYNDSQTAYDASFNEQGEVDQRVIGVRYTRYSPLDH